MLAALLGVVPVHVVTVVIVVHDVDGVVLVLVVVVVPMVEVTAAIVGKGVALTRFISAARRLARINLSLVLTASSSSAVNSFCLITVETT